MFPHGLARPHTSHSWRACEALHAVSALPPLLPLLAVVMPSMLGWMLGLMRNQRAATPRWPLALSFSPATCVQSTEP